ncbi:MAG: hypothetical protein M1818_008268 [Claussenomyces sp. TS43310]|nr:MAG: hypothetical protein M1818_008268 [Claussenomyces sp. TS43310]
MSDDELLPEAAIITAMAADDKDSMNQLAHNVLDDVLYNIIHDIVLNTHREEKMARANSAAIIVEQLAAEKAAEPTPSASESPKEAVKASTPAAIYEDGCIYIRGNPLSTTHEIRCPKCGLPRLLHPTEGVGAQAPEEGITYCKRQPYIIKPFHDIYGQPFPREDIKPSSRKNASSKAQTSSQPEASSFEGSATSTPPPAKGSKPVAAFPNVKCPSCSRYSEVRSFRRHLRACMGISNRQSNRTATLKASSNGLGSRTDSTPPRSRKGSPMLGLAKKSPKKRDKDDLEDTDDYTEEEKKIKKKK